MLPDRHPAIKVEKKDSHYHVTFEQRRWVFPEQDVALLPMDNTTAERLAEFIGEQLLTALAESQVAFQQLHIGVDENEGQWAWCEIEP